MPQIIPFIPTIIGAVSAGVGGAIPNKSTQTQTSTSTPTYDPQSQGIRDLIAGIIGKRLSDNSLPSGYETTGIQGINQTHDAIASRLNADLTARGLGTSPVAGVVNTRATLARAGDIGGFRTRLPLIQRDLQTQDLGLAGEFANTGRGTTSTGTGSTSSGGGAGGAFSNLAEMLGYLTGKGAFGRKSPMQGGGMPASNPNWWSMLPNATGPQLIS